MGFRFQQFEVYDIQSTQRVGTDSMLLGAWAAPDLSCNLILDIGTGCGVLALMIAQKSTALIDAIDLDEASIQEAAQNFKNSPWSGRLNAIEIDAKEFAVSARFRYDYILSNPPFFDNSLKSKDLRKNRARHETDLSLDDLIKTVKKLLSADGKFSTVLPFSKEVEFTHACSLSGLFPTCSLLVSHKPGVMPKRILMEFSRKKVSVTDQKTLTIKNEAGEFSSDYLALTKGYHQF